MNSPSPVQITFILQQTRFHSLILGTSGGIEGLSFVLKMGPYKQQFPMFNSIWQKKMDLGCFYIYVFVHLLTI